LGAWHRGILFGSNTLLILVIAFFQLIP